MKQAFILLIAISAVFADNWEPSGEIIEERVSCYSGGQGKLSRTLKVNPRVNDVEGWVPWDTTKDGVPENAVLAGYDGSKPIYVIRADHTSRDGHAGKIIGKYVPSEKIAVVAYNSKEYKKSTFEILIHSNYYWADKNNKCPNVSGGNGHDICRLVIVDNKYIAPGQLDKNGKNCRVPYDGSEVFSSDYKILKRRC